LTEQTKNIQ